MGDAFDNIMKIILSMPVTFIDRELARKIKLKPAIFYAGLTKKYLYSRKGRLDPEGFFSLSMEEMKDEIALSRSEQSRSIRILLKAGLIDYKLKKNKRYFKVFTDNRHFRRSRKNLHKKEGVY